MQSEFDFINQIRNQAAKQKAKDLVLGIGDDAAILREQSGRETLLTVDLLVEDIDFKLEYTLPRWLGHKALAVSLSDIAAMGGRPQFSLLTLGITKTNQQSDEFWEEFFAGYHSLADEHGVTLIGGDLSSTFDRLTIDSFVVGHCTTGKAIRRSGARVGDGIYITGCVGASGAGLKLLLQGARVNEDEKSLQQKALRAHLKPEPRVAFGRQIGESGLAHAMIDVSDGLAQDLAHICDESRVAAIIDAVAVPVAEEVNLIAEAPESAFAFAISSGEDFELLLTANNDFEQRLNEIAESCEIKITRIGDIIERRNDSNPVLIRREGDVKPLLVQGYDHFHV